MRQSPWPTSPYIMPKINEYVRKVAVPITFVSIIALLVSLGTSKLIETGFVRLFINICLACFQTAEFSHIVWAIILYISSLVHLEIITFCHHGSCSNACLAAQEISQKFLVKFSISSNDMFASALLLRTLAISLALSSLLSMKSAILHILSNAFSFQRHHLTVFLIALCTSACTKVGMSSHHRVQNADK